MLTLNKEVVDMKTTTINGYVYRFFVLNNGEEKYLERVEKDGTIKYFRHFRRDNRYFRECFPDRAHIVGHDEFESVWANLVNIDKRTP